MPKTKVFLTSDILSECSTLDCLLFWNRTMKLYLKLWFQNSYDWVWGWLHITYKPVWLQVVIERDYFGHHFFSPSMSNRALMLLPLIWIHLLCNYRASRWACWTNSPFIHVTSSSISRDGLEGMTGGKGKKLHCLFWYRFSVALH